MAHEVTAPSMVTGASVNGRKLTLDPISRIPITIHVREVESTIPCGFQVNFGEVDVDGHLFEVTAGAGVGSEWLTFRYKGKQYCFPISEVVGKMLDAIDG